jgi:N2-acetyl-L-2,4-diaminobutanoate deacetylase
MSDDPSPVTATIDFDRPGRHRGFLAVASSTNRSAYGTVTIPVTVIAGGEGPTLLLSGGIHGDEYDGPVALMNLARELEPEKVRGRVIMLPCLNLPAVVAGTRLSPIDGLNMNRAFPGRPDGSLSQVIAHYVSTVLLPLCDLHIDFHSGGRTLDYIPCITTKFTGDEARDRRSYAAIMAFGAPLALINRDLDEGGMIETLCMRQGVVNISTELGGGGRVARRNVAIACTGVLNVMRHLDMLDGEPERAEGVGRSRLMKVDDPRCYAMAPDRGIYEPLVELGDQVEPVQVLGRVHYPEHGEKEPWPVEAPTGGTLICRRPDAQVQRGDNVAVIAQDVEVEPF